LKDAQGGGAVILHCREKFGPGLPNLVNILCVHQKKTKGGQSQKGGEGERKRQRKKQKIFFTKDIFKSGVRGGQRGGEKEEKNRQG